MCVLDPCSDCLRLLRSDLLCATVNGKFALIHIGGELFFNGCY